MNLLKKIIAWAPAISVVSLLLMGNIAVVQAVTPTYQGAPQEVTSITSVGGLVGLLGSILQWIYIIFFIVAIIFILVSAFLYVTAGGDPIKVGKAKNYLIYAVIGIVVALLSFGISGIVRSFLTSGTTIST